MELRFFCPRWGCEQIDWDSFCERVLQAGYNGVEYGIPNETEASELDMVWEKLAKYKLDVIPQHYGTYDADFNRHYNSYAAWLEKVSPYPLTHIWFICHTPANR